MSFGVAIITGGASGIGKGFAEAIAKRGGHVVIADRQGDEAKKVAAAIGGEGHALDVRDAKAVKDLVDDVALRKGRLDWMFNNAGIAIGAPAIEHTLDDWNHTLDVNVRGVVHGCMAALSIMQKQRSGHIVNTASVAGLAPLPAAIAYATSKHAVVGLSLSLRVEAALMGVKVSALCPGFVETPILTGGKYGRSVFAGRATDELKRRVGTITVDELVRKSLPRLERGEAIVVEPARYRGMLWFVRTFPRLFEKRMVREVRDILSTR